MITCLPEKSEMLNQFFEHEPIKQPIFSRCVIDREHNNNPIYERQKPIIFSVDGKQDQCINDVIPSGIGNRFFGFSKNIDIDSELKMINHKYTRCDQKQFKLSPNDVRSPLFCNRDMLLSHNIHYNEVVKRKKGSMKCNNWGRS